MFPPPIGGFALPLPPPSFFVFFPTLLEESFSRRTALWGLVPLLKHPLKAGLLQRGRGYNQQEFKGEAFEGGWVGK